MPLGLLLDGEKASIMKIGRNDGPGCGGREKGCHDETLRRAEEIGIKIGKNIEMIHNGGGGSLVIRADESRIALRRNIAMKIMVRRNGE